MDYSKALSALSQCEFQLRIELAAAAQAGDYAAIGLLSQWAQAIAAMVGEAAGEAGELSTASVLPAVPSKTRAAPTRSARGAKQTYPRFVRTTEALVKIGWSKKAKAEYEHKAPLALAKQLAAAAGKLGVKGRVFSIESLAAVLLGDGQAPSYQHYLIVAWLRDAGLIEQHGRKGYSIKKPSTLAADATQHLESLPIHGR